MYFPMGIMQFTPLQLDTLKQASYRKAVMKTYVATVLQSQSLGILSSRLRGPRKKEASGK